MFVGQPVTVKRKPLPKLVYNLLKDSELKKKCKAVGKLHRYCMSEKSWPISYSKLIVELGQDFL